MDEIDTISEAEYLQYARIEEQKMLDDAPDTRGVTAMKEARDAQWAANLCLDPDDPANS